MYKDWRRPHWGTEILMVVALNKNRHNSSAGLNETGLECTWIEQYVHVKKTENTLQENGRIKSEEKYQEDHSKQEQDMKWQITLSRGVPTGKRYTDVIHEEVGHKMLCHNL